MISLFNPFSNCSSIILENNAASTVFLIEIRLKCGWDGSSGPEPPQQPRPKRRHFASASNEAIPSCSMFSRQDAAITNQLHSHDLSEVSGTNLPFPNNGVSASSICHPTAQVGR
jgi:hypothetical protein